MTTTEAPRWVRWVNRAGGLSPWHLRNSLNGTLCGQEIGRSAMEIQGLEPTAGAHCPECRP